MGRSMCTEQVPLDERDAELSCILMVHGNAALEMQMVDGPCLRRTDMRGRSQRQDERTAGAIPGQRDQSFIFDGWQTRKWMLA